MVNHPNRNWRWTQDNTQGFTDAQLDIINDALLELRHEYRGVDRSNLNDAINNAWADQETAAQLKKDVKTHMRAYHE